MSTARGWPVNARVAVAVVVVVVLGALVVRAAADRAGGGVPGAGATTTTMVTTSIAPTSPTVATGGGAAQSMQTLSGVRVASLDSSHLYSRAGDFGPAWTDDNDDLDGHNGCDTRNDILRRDLTSVVARPGTRDCVVIAGQLADRYSGTTISFTKSDANAVQIDHIVPLHDAWQLGAWSWTQQRRVDYANDPMVLLAVSGPLNEKKGDRLADAWTPPNLGESCDYAQRTVAIHAKYQLPVTASERSALMGLLARCG